MVNLTITGATDGLNEIVFDCPKCGSPYQIYVRARFNGPAVDGIYAWSADSQNRITITPSIHNHNHGRKKECGWHGSVINSELK